MKCVFN